MIRELGQNEYDLWDKLVGDSIYGTIFHKSYWLMASGMEFRIYGYFKGDDLFAGIPIAYSISKFGVKKAGHPFLTPYLGIVFRNTNSKYVTRISEEKEIAIEIAHRIKKDFDSITISFSPSFIDLQPFIWEKFSNSIRYTYILRLDDLDDIWKDMDKRRRNSIIKAEKDGIHVEPSDDFEQTFKLVEKTFARQSKNTIFRDQAFGYNEILTQKAQCKSFLAIDEHGQAIGCVYIVWDEKRSYDILGGYDFNESHRGASAIARWEAIKYTKNELGLDQFDFEGSTIQNIESSVRKFGGILTPYYSAYWMKPHIKAISYAKKFLKLD